MKKLFLPLLISSLIVACNRNKDDRFCECMELSTQLDKVTSDVLSGNRTKSSITEEEKGLKSAKDSICAPYELLGAEELILKREACK